MLSRAFCRITAKGLLRICTQSRALPNPLSPHEAWISSGNFWHFPSFAGFQNHLVDDTYCALTCAPGFPHRLWTDAYLAAFAMTTGCRQVSFDSDFKRFTKVDFFLLAPLPRP